MNLVTRQPLAIFHDVGPDFSWLLRQALAGSPVAVAHGPIYDPDPAATVYAPYVRSARESGWTNVLDEEAFAPRWVEEEANALRSEAVRAYLDAGGDLVEVDRWTRAGLVLEIASRWGVPMTSGGRLRVDWRLRGTVTGRFGIREGSPFNPLVIPRKDRARVKASRGRHLATVDFRAMDVCSMVSLVPGLAAKYEDAEDPHARTAELVGLPDRDTAKKEIFVYAYGGETPHAPAFNRALPEIREFTLKMQHGEFPRMVQSISARAFRAGLSSALPMLVTGDVRPIFTVHDELTLEIDNGVRNQGKEVFVGMAMAGGATKAVGVQYRCTSKTGQTYEDCKAEG